MTGRKAKFYLTVFQSIRHKETCFEFPRLKTLKESKIVSHCYIKLFLKSKVYAAAALQKTQKIEINRKQ
jgi:hypothetical protein